MLDMRRPPRVTQSDAIFSVILVSNPYNLPDEESLLQSSGTSNNSFLRIWIVVLTKKIPVTIIHSLFISNIVL